LRPTAPSLEKKKTISPGHILKTKRPALSSPYFSNTVAAAPSSLLERKKTKSLSHRVHLLVINTAASQDPAPPKIPLAPAL
jgi:hypothetical protein